MSWRLDDALDPGAEGLQGPPSTRIRTTVACGRISTRIRIGIRTSTSTEPVAVVNKTATSP